MKKDRVGAIKNVIWITGMSASGKTTLAKLIVEHYKSVNVDVIWLDGDHLRKALSEETYYNRNSRLSLAFKYARIAKMLAEQGFLIVISTVSLYKEIHKWNRENLPGYFEVFIKCGLEELKRRDPKGLYESFDKGKLSNVAGLDLVADFPLQADVVINSDEFTNPTESRDTVIHTFEKSYLTNSTY